MIQDEVLQGRIPRLGSITIGRGVERESRKGNTYAQPTKSQTLVFHTNDPEVANAVQMRFGGDIATDSPTWECDVVTDVREAEVVILAAGFRQALELWRAAECLRRCDGVTMQTRPGRPVNEPCACEPEMERGQDRQCKPSTNLPVLVELDDVERFGVWEIKSTSWGTASAIKGTMRALAMVGATQSSVPAIVSMVDRTVRDSTGQVRDVTEIHATIARSHDTLAALAAQAPSLDGPEPAALGAGSDNAERASLMEEWSALSSRAHGLGLRQRLVEDWRGQFGSGREFDDLDVEEIRGWVALVEATVADEEAMIAAAREEEDQEGSQPEPGAATGDESDPGGGLPPDGGVPAPAPTESVEAGE